MKRINPFKYLVIFFSLLFPLSLMAQEQKINTTTQTRSLESLILELEQNYSLLFSYKEEDIANIKVTPPQGSQPLNTFLKYTLKNSGLNYEIVSEQYIILTKEDTKPPKEDITLTTICGTIQDKATKSPLPFVNVYLKNAKKGTATTKDGKFQLRVAPQSKDSLVISYVGYQAQTLPLHLFSKHPCLVVLMDYLIYEEGLVLVTDYLSDGINLKDNGAYISLRPNLTKPLPGQPEPDILHALSFLPGINSTDGSAANISIRGGSADQNLILWEDIPIYHAGHHFGMVSAFNPYIIDEMNVYRGGLDASQGGRVSGLVDIKSADHQLKNSNFGGGINGISAYTYGKIAVVPSKVSVVYSLRSSIADWWQSPTLESIASRLQQGILIQTTKPGRLPSGININDKLTFTDANLKTSIQLSSKDDLKIAGFRGTNLFEDLINNNNVQSRQSDTLDLINRGLSIAWNRTWSPNFSSKITGVITDYKYQYDYQVTTQNNTPDKRGRKNSAIEESQLNWNNTWKTKQKNTFKFGYQYNHYDVSYSITRSSRENPFIEENTTLQSAVHTGYVSFNSNKHKNYGISTGLRLNYFEKEKSTHLEPRLRLWYNHPQGFNFYANAGRYYQFLSQLIEIEGDKASIDTPVWVLAGQKEVPVLRSDQLILGMLYRKKSWMIDLQFYAKKINGLSSLSSSFDDNLGIKFHIGDAKIKGMDLLIKKRWNNYSSWISYSLSKSTYQFKTFFDPDFPASTDQPHVLHWVNLWDFGNFTCSLGWRLSSGKPYADRENFNIQIINMPGTPPNETIHPIERQLNTKRLPFEHQLDASISYTLKPRKANTWKAVFGFSATNIYHQKNIYERSFYIEKPRNNPPRLKYLNRINMGFTPNLVARFEW